MHRYREVTELPHCVLFVRRLRKGAVVYRAKDMTVAGRVASVEGQPLRTGAGRKAIVDVAR